MSQSFGKGQKIAWNWGTGKGTGKIKEPFEREVTRTLKGDSLMN